MTTIRCSSTPIRGAAGLIGAGVLVAGLAAGAGAAHADDGYRSAYVAMNCSAPSPNIVDLPYDGGVRVDWRSPKPTTVTVLGDSKSLFPYTTDAVITVTDVATRHAHTYRLNYGHSFSDASGFQIANVPARGRTTFTVRATNRGLLTLTAPTCSGTLDIR